MLGGSGRLHLRVLASCAIVGLNEALIRGSSKQGSAAMA